MEISIGKYTLESLTLGMYLSPKILYREYIQNAIDALDEAVIKGIISKSEGKVIVQADKGAKRIVIEDNGTGIEIRKAVNLLIDIGNSNKSPKKNRGFRGIGRLIGLSYSKKLLFSTSYKGEELATTVEFDCVKLNKLLIPGQETNMDLKGVLEKVITISYSPERSDNHYFKVVLEGVVNLDDILDKDTVKTYIAEVAPVPYNMQEFPWFSKIHEAFHENKLPIEEYDIRIKSVDEDEEKIYKLYSAEFLTDKRKKLCDKVHGITIDTIKNQNEKIIGVVWYADTKLQGSILNSSIKGLRLRKGNILVGEKNTLNQIFKEERFNGWVIGEVFVFDENIIPNARRDNFEKNESYLRFLNKLADVGGNISKKIRQASYERLNTQSRGSSIEDVEFEDDFGYIIGEQETLKEKISHINEPFNQLRSLLLSKPEGGNFKYDVLCLLELTVAEKKVLQTVFDTIIENCEKQYADMVIHNIIKKFKLVS